jgi:hypothetical protein
MCHRNNSADKGKITHLYHYSFEYEYSILGYIAMDQQIQQRLFDRSALIGFFFAPSTVKLKFCQRLTGADRLAYDVM